MQRARLLAPHTVMVRALIVGRLSRLGYSLSLESSCVPSAGMHVSPPLRFKPEVAQELLVPRRRRRPGTPDVYTWRHYDMISPEGVAPDNLLGRDKRDEFLNWLLGVPFESKYKEQLLLGFGVQYGVRWSRETYIRVRASGIDRQ
jgi:hypothetical protein